MWDLNFRVEVNIEQIAIITTCSGYSTVEIAQNVAEAGIN